MKLEFTNITKKDLPDCARLYVEVFQESPWNEEWSFEDELERLCDMHNIPGPVGIKATHEGEFCGFLLGRIQKFTGEKSCDVEELCIKNSMQRKGVGSLLMGKLEEQLKNSNVSGIMLITKRNSAPFEFYSSLDYEEVLNLTVMRKKLINADQRTHTET